MIVLGDRSSRALVQRQLYDLARIYARAIDGAAKGFDAVNHTMAPVDKIKPKHS
jgi:hypothetical protein